MQCHFFHTGVCRRGVGCNFKHTEPKLGKCPNKSCRLCENKKPERRRSRSRDREVKPREERENKAKMEIEVTEKAYEMEPEKEEFGEKVESNYQKKGDEVLQNISDGKNKIFATRVRQAYQDLQIFKPLEKIFQSKLSLDLMFIMDCTGSMGSWIKACKKELFNIIDNVLHEHEGAKIRISVIAYRDIKDHKRFEVLPFTQKKDVVLGFIGGLVAMGGNDAPQDICGGFKNALAQDWKSTAKYAVLIADAPCHGKQYHDTADDFPNGDPDKNVPEQQVARFAQMGINLYAIKIANLTDKMYKIFSDSYQQIAKTPMQIANLGQNTDSFGFFISSTVTATLSASVVNSDVSYIKKALKQLKGAQNNKMLTEEQQVQLLMKISSEPVVEQKMLEQIDNKEKTVVYNQKMKDLPNWKQLQNSEIDGCVQHTYFIVKDKGVPINWRAPLLQNSSITSIVRKCKIPFSEGAMRYAFYAYDTLLNQKLVLKENKRSKYSNLDQMSKELQLVYICNHIVNTFNDSIVEIVPDTRLLLTFVHTFLVELKSSKKIYYAQNYIDGDYEKYNNNAGWANNKVSESSMISQAFSHYSHQITEGYLMVVDIQGASGILTDPQIHCLDYERFGSGNLGYEGILKFFFNHKCNQYCKALGLVNPKDTGDLPQKFDFYNKEAVAPKDPKKKVFTICDLCKGAFTSTAGFVYNKRLQDQLKYCPPCDDKRKKSMKKGNCEWCNASFTSSQYWFQMMRTDFPTLCGDCRKKRRQMWRQQKQKTGTITANIRPEFKEIKADKQKPEVIQIQKETKINKTEIKTQQIIKPQIIKPQIKPEPEKKVAEIKLAQKIEEQPIKQEQFVTKRFDLTVFENPQSFKQWMKTFGMQFGVHYKNLKKVHNKEETFGKLDISPEATKKVNGQCYKDKQIQFQ